MEILYAVAFNQVTIAVFLLLVFYVEQLHLIKLYKKSPLKILLFYIVINKIVVINVIKMKKVYMIYLVIIVEIKKIQDKKD